MYKQHFGLTSAPLGKNTSSLWSNDGLTTLKERFTSLLHSPGIGLLTGEPGVGKTAALRHLVKDLNPHQYHVFYLSETQFSSLDIYRQIAFNLGLVPASRFANLWRDIKNQIRDRMENKHCMPLFIIDEAQNLPLDFFKGFPSFLNFDFDARDMMTVWFVGHPVLNSIVDRVAYTAFASRIHVRYQLQAFLDREQFTKLIQHALKEAGCQTTLFTESGIEIMRAASQGRPRSAHRILVGSLQLAMQKGIHHVPDDLLQEAITQLRG